MTGWDLVVWPTRSGPLRLAHRAPFREETRTPRRPRSSSRRNQRRDIRLCHGIMHMPPHQPPISGGGADLHPGPRVRTPSWISARRVVRGWTSSTDSGRSGREAGPVGGSDPASAAALRYPSPASRASFFDAGPATSIPPSRQKPHPPPVAWPAAAHHHAPPASSGCSPSGSSSSPRHGRPGRHVHEALNAVWPLRLEATPDPRHRR